MPDRHDPIRRGLLRRLAALTGAMLLAPWKRLRATPDERELSFRHTHTGEELSVVYRSGGEYVPAALEKVNRLLRDHRTGDMRPIDPELLDILFDLRQVTRETGTYEVISAYRSRATNEMLRSKSRGVAKNSMHVKGRAIDVRLTGVTTVDLRDAALNLARGGVGYYRESDFVHVDNGRVRRW